MTNLISETKNKIVSFLRRNPESSTKDIIDYIDISKQAVAKHLRELMEIGLVDKKGSPPKVYYFIPPKINEYTDLRLKDHENLIAVQSDYSELIENNFVLFTSDGKIVKGFSGFKKWCEDRNFSVHDYTKKYFEITSKYSTYKNTSNLINATDKIKETYKNQCFLDKLFYSEFSAYEVFGRTKLYSYLLHGKQSEDRRLIKETVSLIKEQVLMLVISEKIDAVGFIPPTVPRQIQFQKEFEKNLNLPLPVIKIEKVKNDILIPQKTLKSPVERMENSKKTIVVPESRSFKNILLIDDFVGSGATLNFTAQKLRLKFPDIVNITGYAICGTPNGVVNHSQKFEVVSEV